MKEITVKLNASGIKEMQNAINEYIESLPERIKLFTDKLMEIGIEVAEMESQGDSHHFDGMVAFRYTNEQTVNGSKGEFIGENDDIGGLHTTWYTSDGALQTDVISPILMLEFGSAGRAIMGHNGIGGQGSFAKTGTHVNDLDWWYVESFDSNNKPIYHRATAEEAHEPMYKALLVMRESILEVAKEVF